MHATFRLAASSSTFRARRTHCPTDTTSQVICVPPPPSARIVRENIPTGTGESLPAQQAWASAYRSRTNRPGDHSASVHGVSDDEVIEATLMDRRWQLVLDCLDTDQAPFSKGTFVAFRKRLIDAQMDRRLIERTIELRERQQTVQGRAQLRERVAVEHTLAHVGRWQGRRARYRGLRKNLFDLRRCAVVHNLHVLARSQALSAELQATA
jgi:hypothetical protein